MEVVSLPNSEPVSDTESYADSEADPAPRRTMDESWVSLGGDRETVPNGMVLHYGTEEETERRKLSLFLSGAEEGY